MNGLLKVDFHEDYANTLNDFTACMEAHGAPLDVVEIQNEVGYQVSYQSCDWTAAQVMDFIKDSGDMNLGLVMRSCP